MNRKCDCQLLRRDCRKVDASHWWNDARYSRCVIPRRRRNWRLKLASRR